MKRFIELLIVNCSLLIVNCYSQSLGALIPDFKVNDDLTNYMQEAPRIGVDGQGNFIIVWGDRRNTPIALPYQLYCQRLAFDGTRLGVNFRIGPDTASNSHITVLNDGRFVTAWAGKINSKEDLYCQRFHANGIPNGGSVIVNDTNVIGAYANISDLGADSLGNFVVAWTDYRSGILNPDVYGQRFDSAGNRIGNNFRINDNTNNTEQVAPRVAVNKNGSFIICWVDYRNTANGDIYMQMYDRFGNLIGVNQRVDDDVSSNGQGTCDAACDGKGYFVIAFDDFRELYNTAHVYYQLYDTLGNKIGVNQKADENTGQTGSWTTRVSMQSNGKFVIMWKDYRYVNDVPFAQRFNMNGTKVGVNFRIPEYNNTPDYGSYDFFLYGDRIYTAWNDTRNGNFDIFANVKSFINPDSVLSVVNNGSLFAKNFRLYPAYPNPFNPTTNIKFDIPPSPLNERGDKGEFVILKVYDALGREVVALINQPLKPGTYEVEFDGTNYPSGVYFCKLLMREFTDTKKLVLLK